MNVRLRRAGESARAALLARRPGVEVGRAVGVGPGVRVRVAEGGKLTVGDRSYLDEGVILQVAENAELLIGADCFFGHHSTVAAEESIVVKSGTFLAEMVSIRDHDHVVGAPPRSGGLVNAPVSIGRDVWIGGKASVLRGVDIGDGAVIGAHSLVRDDVPAYHLAVGVPASVQRALDIRSREI